VAYFRLTTPEGVLVSDVEVGSGAERDGLRRGDVIVRANHTKITDVQTLDSTLTQGGDIMLQIVRQARGVSLTLHTSAR
jgi:S1-C subfamily serine protease